VMAIVGLLVFTLSRWFCL